MRPIASLCIASLTLAALAGCGREQPKPLPPPLPPSAWTASDSRQAASELITEALKYPWANEFHERTKQLPRVRIGDINDRAAGQIDILVLSGALEHAVGSNAAVVIAKGGAPADFVLQGVVSEMDGQKQGEPVKYYDFDLKLVDGKSVSVCTLQKEVTKDDSPVAPAPADPAAGH
jgi:predicted small lipoprotein YifL